MRFLNQFRLREKISASFGVLISLMLVNALLLAVGAYKTLQQRDYKENVGQVISEIDKVRLLVAHFVNTPSRSSAQHVFSGLELIRQKMADAHQGLDDAQLRAMQPLLDDFKLHFQKYMVEVDQIAALRSRATMLGLRMSGHLEAAHITTLSAPDHRYLDTVRSQVMALLWAGQAVQSGASPTAAAQMTPIREALARLHGSSQSLRLDDAFQLPMFRIQRDANDYVDSLEDYQRFQRLYTGTQLQLNAISDTLQQSGQQVSRSVDQAIRSRIGRDFTMMGLIFLLTLVSALVLSRYLAREILRPIRSLVTVTHQIGQGELQARASEAVDDEIGELARSFNDMTQRLLDKNQALALAQQQLEQRVLERTRQLADVNASLTSEMAERELAQQAVVSAHLALAGRELILRQIIDTAPIGIFLVDMKGCITRANISMTEMFGYPMDTLVGMEYVALVDPSELEERRQKMLALMNSEIDIVDLDRKFYRANGKPFWGHLTGKLFRGAAGEKLGLVGVIADITSTKEHQQQLENIAHFDALTQLPNRLLLADRLDQAMLQSQRRKNLLAVVYLDLDGFKAINDSYGHDVGDELLMALAHSMKASLREGDTLARIGGDEFVAVLVDLTHFNDHEPLLERLLRAASTPIALTTREGSTNLQVSASAGVTLYPQDNADADLLMRHADQAMYAAKQSGKNRYRLFDVAHDAAVKVQQDSLARIRQALVQGEFVLYYQPKVNLLNGQVSGAEALIRWQHPERGLLAPGQFLPVLEGQPLSTELGEWVIASALAQMRHWQTQGLALPVSVNLSAHQLQRGDFAARLADLLAACPEVAPQQLQLEVLETSSLEDLPRASASMTACQSLGVSFALDDFGTGYSSLTYLRRLPAQTLKIDQSFVRDMLDDPNDLAIVNGVIGLARAFSREVIAEGVETLAHGQLLADIGCTLAQGYGIARPMPAADLPDWIDHWHTGADWAA